MYNQAIDLETHMWDVEFPDNTTISAEKQAEIRALFETDEFQTETSRDVLKQHILFKTGEYFAVTQKYKIILKERV